MGCSEGWWNHCPICGQEFLDWKEWQKHWEAYSWWRKLAFYFGVRER